MVMKRNAMRTNLRQSIVKSLGRYIAIAAIIGLGAALFVGLLMTKTDMVETGQVFMDEQNMFDLRMVSNYGWSEEYVEKFAKLDGVEDAEGVFYIDLIARTGEQETESVYRFYSLPERLNRAALRGGRMPEADNECLADGFYADDSILGQTVTISQTNDDDSLETVRYETFTIVGYVATLLYMDMNRGTTTVGSGSLENYYYIPSGALDADYYTEIHLTMPGDYAVYSEEYNAAVEALTDAIEPEAERLSEERFQEVKAEAEEEYAEGYQEYLDGLEEYEDGKAEAEQELSDAEQELLDAEEELKDNRQKLINGGREIEEGLSQIEVSRSKLIAAEAEFQASKEAAEPQLAAAKAELDANYPTVKAAYDQANAAISQAQSAVDQAAAAIPVEQLNASNAELQSQIAAKQAELAVTEDEATKAAIQTEIDGLSAQVEANNAALAPYQQAVAARDQVKAQCQPALDAMDTLNQGYAAIEAQEQQLAEAEAQIAAGWQEFYAGEIELNNAYDQLQVSWGLLHEGEEELAQGWEDYEEAKIEVAEKLADAEAELKDAKEELADAREEIDSLDEADLIILDRTSNVGYNNLDSSSDIVAGVSRIIPVFFLLVASLVCITTMTRMIDEERTQIGTLKALGYTNSEIMGKYLVYSGSGAVLGCTLGICAGNTVIPMIIWEAYCIMLYIQPNMVLTVSWPLAIAVVVIYTAVMLLVTWYSCHKTLEEEPAELIRPKAPDAGKKILLEYLPFWPKISFLNKVTIRNIFRYRQRLAMMLVGIGGCTALLVTGFGLRDSITNVVDYQFEEVSLYDLTVYFNDGLTEAEQTDFLKEVSDGAEDTMFFHQSSVDLGFNGQTKEIYMVSADEDLQRFMDLHKDDTPLSLPELDEVVLSAGVADALNIGVGDTVTLRNADLQSMELTVSGIYDNHVYNYAIVRPKTIEGWWGALPEQQMAFLKAAEGQDVHALGAGIGDRTEVMNITVVEDIAEMVGGMMEALDLVVMLIVFCAGLLAAIVLYNLTNININERIREIATIKVLGFNASETAAYVFKENLTLSVVGSLLGLLLGKLLLMFVMSQIKIDMIWFKVLTEPVSYLWSVGLTLLSAAVVNFIFYFKLDKINMAEALKSVE